MSSASTSSGDGRRVQAPASRRGVPPGRPGGTGAQRRRAGEQEAARRVRGAVVRMQAAEHDRGDREAGDRAGGDRAERRHDRPLVIRGEGRPPGRCRGQGSGQQELGDVLEGVVVDEFGQRMAAEFDPVVGELGDRRGDLHIDRRTCRRVARAAAGRPERVEFVDREQRRAPVGGTDPMHPPAAHVGVQRGGGHSQQPGGLRGADVGRHSWMMPDA